MKKHYFIPTVIIQTSYVNVMCASGENLINWDAFSAFDDEGGGE